MQINASETEEDEISVVDNENACTAKNPTSISSASVPVVHSDTDNVTGKNVRLSPTNSKICAESNSGVAGLHKNTESCIFDIFLMICFPSSSNLTHI